MFEVVVYSLIGGVISLIGGLLLVQNKKSAQALAVYATPFAAGVLLFMQVPHLIDQYEQRLGGYYQAQVNHLEKYQQIAERQHRGD